MFGNNILLAFKKYAYFAFGKKDIVWLFYGVVVLFHGKIRNFMIRKFYNVDKHTL